MRGWLCWETVCIFILVRFGGSDRSSSLIFIELVYSKKIYKSNMKSGLFPLFSPGRTPSSAANLQRTFSIRSSSASYLFLHVVIVLVCVSKCSLALANKDYYYHPDKIPHNSSNHNDHQQQHESNTMEFVAVVPTSTRSSKVPTATSTEASTISSTSQSSSSTTSRTIGETERERGELINHVISLDRFDFLLGLFEENYEYSQYCFGQIKRLGIIRTFVSLE